MKLPSLSKLNFKQPKLKGVSVGFRFQWAIYLVLVCVLAADLYVLQSGARKLIASQSEEVGARKIVSTRVNFEGYNKALKRIEGADAFLPQQPVARSPFDKPEKK